VNLSAAVYRRVEHPAAGRSLRRLPRAGDVDLRSVGVQRRLHSVAVRRSAVGSSRRHARDGRLACRRECARLLSPLRHRSQNRRVVMPKDVQTKSVIAL